MKKPLFLWGILGLILIVLIIGGIYLFSDKERGVPSEQIAGASNTTATLTSIRSDVFAEKGGTESPVLETASTTLSGNDSVKTGTLGRALIANADFQTVIDHNSEVAITDLEVKNAKLNLNSGSVWLRVQKVFGVGEGVEVETPNAVAAVRGTSFGISYQNGVTTLIVTEGTVGFRSTSSSIETLVHVGEKAIIGLDGKINVSAITTLDKNTEWYKYNNSEEVQATTPSLPVNPVKTPSTSLPSQVLSTSSNTTVIAPPPPILPPPPPLAPPDIEITSVSPQRVADDQSTLVTVNGLNLNAVSILDVGETNFFFTHISDSKITFNLANITPGTYSLIVSGHGTSTILTQAITIYSNSQYNFKQ